MNQTRWAVLQPLIVAVLPSRQPISTTAKADLLPDHRELWQIVDLN